MREKQHAMFSASPSSTARRGRATGPTTMARAATPRHATARSVTPPTSKAAATTPAMRAKPKEATKREALKPEQMTTARKAQQPEMVVVMEGGAVVPRSPGVLSEPPLRGGSRLAGGPPPNAGPLLRRTVSSFTTDAEEVHRLRAQLQGMKEQVYFLHKMMQGLSGQEKQLLKGRHLPVEDKRLSFAGISPVKKTRGSVDVIVMPDEKIPFSDKWSLSPTHEPQQNLMDIPSFSHDPVSAARPSTKEWELQAKMEAMQLENAALKSQLEQQKQAAAVAEAEHQSQIDEWSTKIAVLDAENTNLLSNIEEFEEENLRLHDALAQIAHDHSISVDSNNRRRTHSGDVDDELGIDGLGEEPQDIHERCDAKIHELWQTIKTLKAYVETFRVEIEDLKVQRDNAVQSAERAWKENVKLAGNNNPQQKIKYLEIVKKENAELIQKVRELQSKLTKKQLRGDDGDAKKSTKRGSGSGSEPLEEYPSMVDSDDVPSDDGSEGERTKLLKKMWVRNKKLEEEIDRLRKEKQELVMRQPRSRSIDSRQSSTKSTKSTTSSRWKS